MIIQSNPSTYSPWCCIHLRWRLLLLLLLTLSHSEIFNPIQTNPNPIIAPAPRCYIQFRDVFFSPLLRSSVQTISYSITHSLMHWSTNDSLLGFHLWTFLGSLFIFLCLKGHRSPNPPPRLEVVGCFETQRSEHWIA